MVSTYAVAHRIISDQFRSRSRALNVTILALNAILGSAIFGTLRCDGEYAEPIRMATGALSVVIAVLTAIQQALDYRKRGEDHSNAQKQYAKIKQRMELLDEVRHVPVVDIETTEMNSEWCALLEDWATVKQDAPNVSRRTSGQGWRALSGVKLGLHRSCLLPSPPSPSPSPPPTSPPLTLRSPGHPPIRPK